MQRIVIVGGGIGGLCAARAVALAGQEPVVLERSRSSAAIGAGLVLWPNAVHALDALGFGSAVRSVAEPAQHTVFRDAAGRTLSEIDIKAVGRHAGAPMLVIERAALHEVLVAGMTVRYQSTVSTVDERGVILAGGERIDADAVIGADGVGSVVREHVCPGVRPLDSGYTAIRGIAARDIGQGEAFEAWGSGEIVGGAALPGARSYWFYEAPSTLVDGRDPLAVVDAARWPAPIPALLAATPPESILVNRILHLPTLPTWTRGTTALLGDAAHAMKPNLGQGAAQTIEDTEALLIALRASNELPRALAAYATTRRRRAHMFQRESSRFARLALSTHTRPRNLVMRLSPETVRRRTMEAMLRRHAPTRTAPSTPVPHEPAEQAPTAT